VQFHRYTTNYGGPLRKDKQLKTGASFQLHAEVLINVVYRLYARIERIGYNPINAVHRALDSGRFHHMPFLGWREFTPSYVGHFREETQVAENETHFLPTMHYSVFDTLRNGRVNPQVQRNVSILNGRLDYV
jgi:CRISPR-associated protein Cas5d